VAVITGGAGGIGSATVRRFVEEGARVGIADVDEARGRALADELGDAALFLRCDHGSADDCRAAVAAVVARWGQLDILFNNAGIGWTGSFDEVDDSQVAAVLRANLVGPILMTRAALPALRERGQALRARNTSPVILFTASGLGLHARPMVSLYTVSKHGIVGMMRSLALDEGPNNLRVNAICPGIVETPLMYRTMARLGDARTLLERFRQEAPLKRIADTSDIANAAVFLASDEAKTIHGACLVVDGGVHG
jgi:NAD(P)-dependent dehydrogenase (short-subunit alcohol dehydrogenase family)